MVKWFVWARKWVLCGGKWRLGRCDGFSGRFPGGLTAFGGYGSAGSGRIEGFGVGGERMLLTAAVIVIDEIEGDGDNVKLTSLGS